MIKNFTSHILPPATAALEAGIVDYALAGTLARGAAIGLIAGAVYHVALAVINKNYDLESPTKHCIAFVSSTILTSLSVYIASAAGLTSISLLSFGVIGLTALAVDIIFYFMFKKEDQLEKPLTHPSLKPVSKPIAPVPPQVETPAMPERPVMPVQCMAQPLPIPRAQIAAPAAQPAIPHPVQIAAAAAPMPPPPPRRQSFDAPAPAVQLEVPHPVRMASAVAPMPPSPPPRGQPVVAFHADNIHQARRQLFERRAAAHPTLPPPPQPAAQLPQAAAPAAAGIGTNFMARVFRGWGGESTNVAPAAAKPQVASSPASQPAAAPALPPQWNSLTKDEQLREACRIGRDDLVRALLAEQVNVNGVDRDGNTPLHLASMNGHYRVIPLLLANRGSNMEIINNDGKSALHVALLKVAGDYLWFDGMPVKRELVNAACQACHLDPALIIKLAPIFNAYAQTEVLQILMSQQNSDTRSKLLQEVMIVALNDFNVTASSPHDKARLLKEKPFVMSVRENDVTLETSEENEVIRKDFSKAELYRLWNDVRKDPVPIREKMVAEHYKRLPEGGSYQLVLQRTAVTDYPEDILTQVAERYFANSVRSQFNVTFSREQGSDCGGLRRQFVTDLFSNICQKWQFQQFENGLYRPRSREQNNPIYPLLSPAEKKKLRYLGEMIMFCLNASEEYPIGKVFDRSTFQAIVKMDWNLLRSNFDEVNFQEPEIFAKMLAIYKEMAREHESEIQMLAQFERHQSLTADSPAADLRAAYGGVMLEDQIQRLNIGDDIDKMKRHLSEIKAALKSSLIESMRANFAPLHAIATGMKRSRFNSRKSFADIQRLQPSELDVLLQGQVSKDEIVNRRLVFYDIPQNIQNWLKGWIMRADDANLELFLFAVTGSRSLGRNGNICIVNNTALTFRTCSKTLDLNCASFRSEEDLVGTLEAGLVAVRTRPGFDLA